MINKRLIFLIFASLFMTQALVASPYTGKNKNGSTVTGIMTAVFNPSAGQLPFPHNLLFTGTKDLTLNPPVANPANIGDPAVALSAQDGFSTTEKWVASFVNGARAAAPIDPASVVPGQSVRVFQVTTQQFLVVTGIVAELIPGVDFVAVASGNSVAIVPLKPLKQYSSYMAVLTNSIRDTAGNDATPDQTYFFTKRRTPWIDANGHSTYPLIDDPTARALEPLRQVTQSMELNAATKGINPDDIVLSWTVQTQSITPTLKLLRSIAAPMPVLAAKTGLNTSAVGGFGLADIVMGVITLPYYSGIPSAANPIAPLTDFWKAPPGGYVPPFNQFGLDPTSTNVTIANPFPVLTGMQTVPLMLTVPNANSGFTKPAGGWPVVIYIHGITRNRTDMLTMADAIASVGYAFIAIDQPLHGVVPDVAPQLAPFYIENTPFGPIANERTFDADFFNNTTGAFGPDGIKDPSGASFFNLGNMRAVRDNIRQAQVDFSTLAVSLQNVSYDGDAIPDLNGMNVATVAQSFGTFTATAFLAVEPAVSRAYYSAAGAVLLRTAEAGAFGVQIRAALAARGVLPGTPQFEQFMLVGQTVLGSADPASWAAEAVTRIPLIHGEIVNDNTVPNVVPGSPMAGNEGLNRLMGLLSYSSSQANPAGLRAVARFLPPAIHSSLLSPAAAPASTAEMQGQMASFIASLGTYVQVSNSSVLLPVAQEEISAESEAAAAGAATDTSMVASLVVSAGADLDSISIEPMSIVVQEGEAANE